VSHHGLSRGLCCLCLAITLAGCGVAPVTPAGAPDASPTPTDVDVLPTQLPSTTSPPVPERPLLIAHTMPWYETPEVSGVWGWHWTMEHFNPTQVREDGQPDVAAHDTPLTGPYDSRDEAILEYQTLLMKLSGIDGVIVDWYGIEEFWDYGAINRATQALFDAVKRAGLQFAICYEDQTVWHMVDNRHLSAGDVTAHGQQVLRYLQETWFDDEAYLKIEGRPALFIFGPQYFKNASDWETLFSVLPARPAFITLDRHTESAALTSFPWPPMWASVDGVLTQEMLEDYLEGFYQKAQRWDYLVAGAFPGFHDIYREAGVGDSYGYLDAQQGETFRLTLEIALRYDPDLIQLITWNDYGEGTMIEPTVGAGTRYLEIVQETRRAMDQGEFPYDAEDLDLPLRLLNARRQAAGDAGAHARLDEVFEALIAGAPDEAAAILDEITLE
jgi:hypothetical protein